jgi:TRAP-type mannitol/chloroaromatic compound transport system substrate-binding protein
MRRRDFIKGVGAGSLAAGGLIAGAPAVARPSRIRWRMVTAWPPGFPILQEGAERFANTVTEMTGGELTIQVFAGGQLVPAMETFAAVSRGTVQAGHGASYYWAGRIPAAEFFTAMPFGMTAQQMNAWLYSGGGLELWREVYAPSNVIPFPLGNTGAQMAGWFKKPIESVADLRGLKMRIPGIGGRVLAQAGGTPVLLAGSEIYPALERGVVDAVEWVNPYFDIRLGLHRAARYYYYPGWQEPSAATELLIHQRAWDELPKEMQSVIDTAAQAVNLWMLSEAEARNHEPLRTLVNEHGVELRQFPDEVLAHLREMSRVVVREQAAKDSVYRRVMEAYNSFQDDIMSWHELSEAAVYRQLLADF